MDNARYLPASRVRAGSHGIGSLSLVAIDGRDLGKLLGFVIEPGSPRIRSLVVEAAGMQREVPMGPLQFDPASKSLRIVAPSGDVDPGSVAFSPGSIPVIADEDLWVPFFHTAA